MNYLIITDDASFSTEIQTVIKKADSSAKFFESDYSSEQLLKLTKSEHLYPVTIRYKSDDLKFSDTQKSVVSFISGMLSGKNLKIISNFNLFEDSSYTPGDLFFKADTKTKIKNLLKKRLPDFLAEEQKDAAKRELLQRGIPVTPNCFATYLSKDKDDICDLFLETGIDINSKDENGTPLLNVAVRADKISYVEKFLELGADINSISEDRGYTAVMDAVWTGNKDICAYLIQKGAELNTISKEGQSNLVLAVGANQKEICELLAKNGADPDVKDRMGMSAYQYASLFKKTEILDILRPYHKES